MLVKQTHKQNEKGEKQVRSDKKVKRDLRACEEKEEEKEGTVEKGKENEMRGKKLCGFLIFKL